MAGVDHEGSFTGHGREDLLDIVRVNVGGDGGRDAGILARRNRTQRFVLINACSLAAVTRCRSKATYAASKRFVLDFSLALTRGARRRRLRHRALPRRLPTTRASVRGIFSQGLIGRSSPRSALDRRRSPRSTRPRPTGAVCVPGCSAVDCTHSPRHRQGGGLGCRSAVAASPQQRLPTRRRGARRRCARHLRLEARRCSARERQW